MIQYLLLLHETPADSSDIGPAEMAAMIEKYRAWSRGLAERGLLVSGEKLAEDGGRHLKLQGGRPLASDGAYAEAHDVIGGFFMIRAEDDAQAEQLAATCPHLAGRQWIEIRRVEAT